MKVTDRPIWLEAPFVRLFFPFSAGIILGHYHYVLIPLAWCAIVGCAAALLCFTLLRSFTAFRYYGINGVFINIILFACGCIFNHYKDPRTDPSWIEHQHYHGKMIVVTLKEPVSGRGAYYKAIAAVDYFVSGDSLIKASGDIIVYFRKGSSVPLPKYKSVLIFRKELQTISSSGNPGSFDYRAYCALSGIYHQVFLNHGEYGMIMRRRVSVAER